MKTLTKRILALLLAAMCLLCLAACAKKEPTFLNEKVTAMIDCDVAHDPVGGFALLYPGVTDLETFTATAEQMYAYFPVTAGYTWKLGRWNYTKAMSSGNEVYEGEYEVTFDGRTVLIYAVWRSDEGGAGFTRFQVVSQEDYLAAQQNK